MSYGSTPPPPPPPPPGSGAPPPEDGGSGPSPWGGQSPWGATPAGPPSGAQQPPFDQPAGASPYPPAPPPPPYGQPGAGAPPYSAPSAPYGAPYAAPYSGVPTRNSNALVALVCGIVGLFLCGVVLGPVAIFMSRKAQSEIAASGGAQTGAGMAKAGMILGIVALTFWALGLVAQLSGVLRS